MQASLPTSRHMMEMTTGLEAENNELRSVQEELRAKISDFEKEIEALAAQLSITDDAIAEGLQEIGSGIESISGPSVFPGMDGPQKQIKLEVERADVPDAEFKKEAPKTDAPERETEKAAIITVQVPDNKIAKIDEVADSVVKKNMKSLEAAPDVSMKVADQKNQPTPKPTQKHDREIEPVGRANTSNEEVPQASPSSRETRAESPQTQALKRSVTEMEKETSTLKDALQTALSTPPNGLDETTAAEPMKKLIPRVGSIQKHSMLMMEALNNSRAETQESKRKTIELLRRASGLQEQLSKASVLNAHLRTQVNLCAHPVLQKTLVLLPQEMGYLQINPESIHLLATFVYTFCSYFFNLLYLLEMESQDSLRRTPSTCKTLRYSWKNLHCVKLSPKGQIC